MHAEQQNNVSHRSHFRSEIDTYRNLRVPVTLSLLVIHDPVNLCILVAAYKNIKSLLQTCVGSYNLCMDNLALRPVQLSPVIKAIQCQSTLKQLHLKGKLVWYTKSVYCTKISIYEGAYLMPKFVSVAVIFCRFTFRSVVEELLNWA